MKYMFFILSLLASFLFFSISSLATYTTYVLDEIGITVDIPDEYIVFTRGVTADTPNLDVYGFSAEEMLKYFEQDNSYLNVTDSALSFEIILTMDYVGEADFNKMSEVDLEKIMNAVDEKFRNVGCLPIKSEFYQHRQERFIVFYRFQKQGAMQEYVLQYLTVCAGKSINILFHTHGDPITEDQEALMKGIVDSIVFKDYPTRESFEEVNSTGHTSSGEAIAQLADGLVTKESSVVLYILVWGFSIALLIRHRRRTRKKNDTLNPHSNQSNTPFL